MFIEIRLCNLMTYVFKGCVKFVKIYMVKYINIKKAKNNESFVNTKEIHKHNVIFNKTVTKLVTVLTKCFFPYLIPTSYVK